MPTAPANAYIHEISRDSSEQYVVIIAGGVIRVFALDGTEKTVTAPGGWGYLSGITDYGSGLSVLTVADYTFVVNKSRTPEMLDDGTTPQPTHYVWPNPDFGTDGDGVKYGPGKKYQYKEAMAGGQYVGDVQSFDKLPATAADGTIYRIRGTDETQFVSYYVRRSGGVWDETVKPGLLNAIDATTMPHALVREADGTFTFAPFSWAPRRVGDESTNPNPGFIGRTIRGVFFYQNRLAFLSDDSVILSVSGEFGNFWRMTVLDYIASDVIDAAATTTKVALLEHAVPFNDGIVLLSDQIQFSMSNGEDGLSATSVAIKPITNYKVATRAAPATIGSEVYFPAETNGWATIYEYSRQADSDATSAADVTAHVKTYIPAGVHRLTGADDQNAVFVLTNGAPSRVYVYQFYWVSASEKVQSAWHYWDLGTGARALSAAYLQGHLYLLVTRSDGLYLERIDLPAAAKPTITDAQVHLDRRVILTGTFNAATGRTEFAPPYNATLGNLQVIRGNAFTSRPMSLIDTSDYQLLGPRTLSVPGNETAGPVVVGFKYEMAFTLSQLFLRRQDKSPVTTGRMQLRTLTVSYARTGFFRTSVQPYGAALPPEVEEVLPGLLSDFSGKVVGSYELTLNRPHLATGDYGFQIYGENELAIISISNDSHVGSTFVSAEFEAFYWNRASL